MNAECAQLVDHYLGGDDPLISRMRHDFDAGRRTALVVNSYEQVRLIKDHARRNHGSVGRRIVGVVDQIEDIPFSEAGEWVTASQVERLGARDDWDAVVFPYARHRSRREYRLSRWTAEA